MYICSRWNGGSAASSLFRFLHILSLSLSHSHAPLAPFLASSLSESRELYRLFSSHGAHNRMWNERQKCIQVWLFTFVFVFSKMKNLSTGNDEFEQKAKISPMQVGRFATDKCWNSEILWLIPLSLRKNRELVRHNGWTKMNCDCSSYCNCYNKTKKVNYHRYTHFNSFIFCSIRLQSVPSSVKYYFTPCLNYK